MYSTYNEGKSVVAEKFIRGKKKQDLIVASKIFILFKQQKV